MVYSWVDAFCQQFDQILCWSNSYASIFFQLNIPQLLQGGDNVNGIGILEVNLRKAVDIKERSSKLDTSVDPYVNFMFGAP